MPKLAHRFVPTNGIRMCYAESGSGPIVLMCHGFPESLSSWRHQIRALAEAGFRAVAPDRCFRRSEMYPRGDADDLFDELRGRPLQEAGVPGLRCLDRLALQDVGAWNPA
jgi:pimeloyl-ACP methyl ester carboxylesterase